MKAALAVFLSMTPVVYAVEIQAPKGVGMESPVNAAVGVPSLPLPAAMSPAIPPQAGAGAVFGRLLKWLSGSGDGQSPASQPQPAQVAKPEAARQRLDLMFEGGTQVSDSRLDAPEGTAYVLGYNNGADRVLYHSLQSKGRMIEQFWKVEGKTIRLAEQRVLSRSSILDEYGSMQVSRFEKRPSGRPKIAIKVMKWKPSRESYGGAYPSGAIDDGMISYYPDKAHPLKVYSSSSYGLVRPRTMHIHSSVKTYFEGKVVLHQETFRNNSDYGTRNQEKTTDGNGRELPPLPRQ